mmetsp:Transcript_44410/g.67983  ORF Transcript_44410/g.67983 Transcript_44410/m.67983 type:complete len:341 (-) Transcript_44410:38-1060(-)
MTTESVALTWGAALVGFAPLLCFFFQITYQKSQLIIVFITAAFFYLLASLSAAIFWYILDPIIGLENAWSAILPGIAFQFIFRCAFVALYHKVEAVIEYSIERTEEDQREGDAEPTDMTTAKLKLELNDVASGVAAGTGFGGMHAILMFGSLLAYESSDLGILYQPSCPYLPSLLVSALNCFFFFFLDIFWMLFTFFGMRRRLIFPRGGGTLHDMNPSRRWFGSYYGNTRSGGNSALVTVLTTHTLAAGFTTFNVFQYGCVLSLSLVPVVLVGIAWTFWSGISSIYTPMPHSTARLSLPASYSYGSRAEAANNDEEYEDENEEDDLGSDADAVQRARSRD